MITNAFKKAMLFSMTLMRYGDSSRPSLLPQDTITFTGLNGTTYKLARVDYTNCALAEVLYRKPGIGETYVSTASNVSSYSGAIFGNGENPVVTADDYQLSGSRITTLNITSTTHGVVVNEGTYTLKTIYTLTNTSAEEIKITEVGAVGLLNSQSYYISTLLDHTVLATPVTIPAGGVGQVEYTITINDPA